MSPDFLCRWQVRVSVYCARRIPAHPRCTQCSILLHLIDICFLPCICLWQISKIQTCLCVVVGPEYVSTSPAFMRLSAGHPAGRHDRLGQNAKSGPLCWGRAVSTQFARQFVTAVTAHSLYAVSFGHYSSSSSCHKTCVFHLSTHLFAISLIKLFGYSNEQSRARRVHCIMCVFVNIARPQNKSSNLCLIRVCAQTVGSIILCKFIQCISNFSFYLCFVNEEYWAVTHRSSAYMKLCVPS